MNVQTERLENHSARLTVEVPQERYSKAREASIKTISAKINIPGFRKGKVPASMVVKYVGEAYILEEVMEHLGQEVYIALTKADVGRGLVAGLAVAFIAIIADLGGEPNALSIQSTGKIVSG